MEGKLETFKLVNQDKAEPEKGTISFQSPLGQALLGHQEKEEVIVPLPNNRQVKCQIIKIQ